MKVTPWFDGSELPEYVGVYERDYGPGATEKCYCKWDGRQWWCWYDTPEDAAKALTDSDFQNLPWRGLAQQPKGKK
jgi:hypothetical protein